MEETFVYIILTIIFLVIGALTKKKDPSKKPKTQPSREIIDEMPDELKRFFNIEEVPEKDETLEDVDYETSNEVKQSEKEKYKYIDTPDNSIEFQDREEILEHFRTDDEYKKKFRNKIAKEFDLRTAIIYKEILDRKYF